MSNTPLVTVICLCHNHSPYLVEALNSVKNQDYDTIEMIIVDDYSSDNSVEIIESWIKNSKIQFIKNLTNLGNNKSFNKALKHSNGTYVVDFATDDVMLPNAISEKVKVFTASLNPNLGVVFSNVEHIDKDGNHLNYEYPLNHQGVANSKPKTGDIYKELVSSYFICSISMMTKKIVLDTLGGYDESLAYEDLDFWFRSSREFEYDYVDKVLIKKRRLSNSLGKSFYKFGGNKLSHSTYKVCKKAFKLNKTKLEHRSLINRINYELRLALKHFDILSFLTFFVLKTKVLFHLAFRRKP